MSRDTAPRDTAPRDTAQWYRTFGQVEARGNSAIYEGWAAGVAADTELLALIDQLPLQKRQPNLIFACARLLGAPEGGYGPFRQWMLRHFAAVAAATQTRSTQTNEPRRTATLLPALSLIPGPLALLEVGASAGLCLYPDRYSYRYSGHPQLDPESGASTVLLESAVTGPVPVPATLPTIVWRAGLDLAPLDVCNTTDMHWLETLVWPEQNERRERLRAAVALAAQHPPLVVQGDAVDDLAALAARAPSDATLVIISSAVLVYLPAAQRERFTQKVAALRATRGARWISLEGIGGLPAVKAALPAALPDDRPAALPDDRPAAAPPGRFVLALDERPLAYTGAHGQSLHWF